MAEKIAPGSDPGKLGAGYGGGALPKGTGGSLSPYQKFVADKAASREAAEPKSQFSLPKEPMYEIWSKRQNKKIGTAVSLKSANRMIDRHDNNYGAYDHYKKKIGRDE